MLVALVCNCAGSVPLVRRFLSDSHHPDPFSVPLYKGDEAKRYVDAHNWGDISAHIANHSAYAILVGATAQTDSDYHVWADINLRASQRITAKVIVEEFA